MKEKEAPTKVKVTEKDFTLKQSLSATATLRGNSL